jgi:hypothetical protein
VHYGTINFFLVGEENFLTGSIPFQNYLEDYRSRMADKAVDNQDHLMDDEIDIDENETTKNTQTPKSSRSVSRKLIVVLENASLEASQVHPYKQDKIQLLNCDDHQALLKRLNRDIAEARPDIVHQVRSSYSTVAGHSYRFELSHFGSTVSANTIYTEIQ